MRMSFVEESGTDLRLGLRQLRSHPAFSLVIVATLALGIAASTTVFTVVDHVLLRPLPYAEPARALAVWRTDARTGERRQGVPPADFVSWVERSRSMESWGLAEPFGYDLTSVTPPEPVSAWLVTPGFFASLGVTPLLGRTFTAEEAEPGGPRSVVLSHRFWQRRLAGDRAVLGRTLELDGIAATVVGVLPAGAEYPEWREVYVPLVLTEEVRKDRRSTYRPVVARLRPGIALDQARAEMDAVGRQLAREFPATNATAGVSLVPLEEQVVGDVRPALRLMAGAAALLLLIACANASGLLLARHGERGQEMAVRSTLGASAGRLLRQLLAETTALGAMAGVAGLALAAGLVAAVRRVLPADLPRAESIAVDRSVVLFALVVTAATVVLAALLPALQAARQVAAATLRGSAPTLAGGPRRLRARRLLVTSQVALAVLLLVGGSLLARSYRNLLANDRGFDAARRATVQAFLWDRNPTPAQRMERVREISERFASLPGVVGVAAATAPPFHPHRIASRSTLLRLDQPPPAAGHELRAVTHVVSPSYFGVLGMRIVRGRALEDADGPQAPLVAVINETAARRAFGAEDPLGRRVRFGAMGAPQEREVVGVVQDARTVALDADPEPEAYVPIAQSGNGSITFVVQTTGEAADLLPLLRQRLFEVDPGQSVYHAGTLDELVAETLRARRLGLAVMGAFSAIAFVFASLGVYGIVSFATRQRTREIGVRMALGARAGQIVVMIVREGLALAAPGVLLGVALALAAGRFLASVLYGVQPTDAATLAEVALLLLGTGALAAWLPARRAAGFEPWRALRSE